MTPREIPRPVAGLLTASLLVAATLAAGVAAVADEPAVLQPDPQIEDGCESQGGTDQDVNVTDVDALIVDPDGGDLILRLCSNPNEETFRRAAQSSWNGWRVLWTDEQDTAWEVRAWIQEASVRTETEYRQQACRNGQEIGDETGENTGSRPNPNAEEDRWLVLEFTGFARDRFRMDQIVALGGAFNRTTNLERDCSTDWTTADRAPDDGFAGPIPLSTPRADDLNVTPRDGPDRSVEPGGTARYELEVSHGLTVDVDVTINTTAPDGWAADPDLPTLTVVNGTTQEVGLTVDVPDDAPPGDHALEVTATGAVDPGPPGEALAVPLTVTVTEEAGLLPGPGAVAALVAVGVAAALHRSRSS